MTFLQRINELTPIIYPEFYTIKDEKNNEYIFLKDGKSIKKISQIDDRTAYEAFINHFHIFDRVKKEQFDDAIRFGKATAKNLFKSLCHAFPNKKFVVYLISDRNDSTIIRFHQLWENEIPYYVDFTNNENYVMMKFTNA